jgi:hypothetical protein
MGALMRLLPFADLLSSHGVNGIKATQRIEIPASSPYFYSLVIQWFRKAAIAAGLPSGTTGIASFM